VSVKMSEREIQDLQLEDIGTRKDSQYRAAETLLVKQLRTLGQAPAKPYNPTSANLPAALEKP